MTHILDEVDLGAALLQHEWRITIQCPIGGVEVLTKAPGRDR